MQEEGKLKPIKKSAFEELVKKEGLLLETGLFVELTKWFKGEKNRVDLVLMLQIYKRLFPEVSLPLKKKKKGSVVLPGDASQSQVDGASPSGGGLSDGASSAIISAIMIEIIRDISLIRQASNLEQFRAQLSEVKRKGQDEEKFRKHLEEILDAEYAEEEGIEETDIEENETRDGEEVGPDQSRTSIENEGEQESEFDANQERQSVKIEVTEKPEDDQDQIRTSVKSVSKRESVKSTGSKGQAGRKSSKKASETRKSKSVVQIFTDADNLQSVRISMSKNN